ncbi:MAG: 50S ribosomal protein L21, partial [Actinobacteria bacterium]|nr:50S ribosomal protein L21 [Actinomycetota bacterium]
KLLPALYNLAHEGALPERFGLVGSARTEMTDDEFAEMAIQSVREFSRRPPDEKVLAKLFADTRYVTGSFDDDEVYAGLSDALDELDEALAPLGLVYPVFPGEYSASIGGNVATNAGGMRAVKYGVTRHQVLGVEAVLPTGEVIRTGGKQYRVSEGQTLLVERLPGDAGATVDLQPLLYAGDEAVFDADGLKQVSVTARIVGHERGEKLRVFKFKPKRGYKRTTGHRQELTRLEITEVKG